ncbi:ATP-binding protein [Zhongshania sp.]|uniref:ATP-binding protein n=1 Tax=Zhongshania sp. TaxID=1971902 RepID=UPI0035692D16
MKLDYGKYRGIIVSIALFLLLDASVMSLNFYISYEISEDAVGVNIAGRQRMLSQRMMKSLLDMRSALADTKVVESGFVSELAAILTPTLTELNSTVDMFHTTLIAFDEGGLAPGAEGGDVLLKPAGSVGSIAALQEAKQIWTPFYKQLNTLQKIDFATEPQIFSTQLASAVAYGREHNLALLKLMNQLTGELENVASSKASRLRWIQTAGISLAIINFFIIMFHFLRQLRDSDRHIEVARKETQEILDTVSEGLFLLDKDQVIGEQCSEALAGMFGRNDLAGKGFSDLLDGVVSEKDRATAASYIGLLFDSRKKQKLIGDLNPLRQVEVYIPQSDGTYINKYLSFSFSRVMSEGKIIHILVTIVDVSKQVLLAGELDVARAQGQEQLALLSTVLQADSDLLDMFLKNSVKSFAKINDILRHQARSAPQYLDKANQIFALVHNYKGEASALNLSRFSSQAHEFEEQIIALKNRSSLSGNDFLGLAVILNKLIAETERIQDLLNKVASFKTSSSGVRKLVAVKGSDYFAVNHLHMLATKMSERQGKEVEVVCTGFNDVVLGEEVHAQLNTLAVQMVRNAVSHGIETSAARILAGKRPQGEINLRIAKRNSGDLQLVCEDDGSGLNRVAILRAALQRGIISAEDELGGDERRLAELIFHPDFSTRDIADEDAGRGMGLFALRQIVRDMGGKIAINSRVGRGVRFAISIPAAVLQNSAAA